MDTGTIVTVIVVVLVVAVLIALLLAAQRKKRSQSLQDRFGPEYERAVTDSGDRRSAEKELADRQERREKLTIRELDPVRRQHFTGAWQQVQADFVDHPVAAVQAGLRLVREVMGERGYPVEDVDRDADYVSVDHPEVAEDYREANRVTRASERNEATTEELRRAMVHYRSLFGRLLGTGDDAATAGAPAGSSTQTAPSAPADAAATAPAAAPAATDTPTTTDAPTTTAPASAPADPASAPADDRTRGQHRADTPASGVEGHPPAAEPRPGEAPPRPTETGEPR